MVARGIQVKITLDKVNAKNFPEGAPYCALYADEAQSRVDPSRE